MCGAGSFMPTNSEPVCATQTMWCRCEDVLHKPCPCRNDVFTSSHRMCWRSHPLCWPSWGTAPSAGTHWRRPGWAVAGRWRSWWWVRRLAVVMTCPASPLAASPQSSSVHAGTYVWRSRWSLSCWWSPDFPAPSRHRSCWGRKCHRTRPRRGQHAWCVWSHPKEGWSCPRRARFWIAASPESQTLGPLSLAVCPDSWC